MSRYILLILSIIFCLIGMKMLMYKTGDHDHDFIFKIMGIIIFLPFFLLLLSALRITNRFMININIEYCEKWNYRPEFDRVSKIILSINSNANIIGNSNLPRTGSFEVLIDDKLVFSKLNSNSFPNLEEIYSWFEWSVCKL